MRRTSPSPGRISPELVLVDPELRARIRWDAPVAEAGDAAGLAFERPVARSAQQRRSGARVASLPIGRRAGLMLCVGAACLGVGAFGAGAVDPTGVAEAPAERMPEAAQVWSRPGLSLGASPDRVAGRPRASAGPASQPEARPVREVARGAAKPGRAVPSSPASTKTARPARKQDARPLPVRPPASPTRRATTKQGQNISTAVQKTGLQRPTVSWKPVAGASYYNLILWRGSRRILDVWPEAPRTVLPTTWRSEGVTRSLAPGRYLWFAYPGIGPKSESRYGTPVRSGVLVVSDRK